MQLFPLDENGDVLRRMVKYGDNLELPRDIDFIVVTPTEMAAQKLAEAVRAWGYSVKIERCAVVPELPWEAQVINHMLPTHEGITQFEQRLGDEAKLVGGRNDGWGCLQQD